MKKTIFATFIIFSIFINSYAQSTLNEIYKERKLVETTVWDISGSCTSGYLYSVKDSIIAISNLEKDSLQFINFQDIYRIKVYQKAGRLETFVSLFSIFQIINLSAAIGSELLGNYSFITALGFGEIICLPLSLAGFLFKNQLNYDFIADSNYYKIKMINPVLQKNDDKFGLFPEIDSNSVKNNFSEIEVTRKQRNDSEISKIEKPDKIYSPDYVSKISIAVSYKSDFPYFFKENLEKLSEKSDFGLKSYSIEKKKTLDFKISVKFANNYRISFNTNRLKFNTWSNSANDFDYELNMLNKTFFIEYVPRPVISVLQTRHEFSAGIGVTQVKGDLMNIAYITDIELNKYYAINIQTINFFAFNCSASYDFYISRNLSLQTRLLASFSHDIKTDEINFNFSNGISKKALSGKLNLSNLQWIVGLAFHL